MLRRSLSGGLASSVRRCVTFWFRVLVSLGGLLSSLARRALAAWLWLAPHQQLVLGFAFYALTGALLLSLPAAQVSPVSFIDNLFGATSAVSTTGLATVATGPSYTPLGQAIHLVLFQIGGIGYMTLTSFILLARGRALSAPRLGVLEAGFALPRYFRIDRFITHVVVFTAIAQGIGALVLWHAFARAGVENALWAAVFHAVSAFATAGFSLYPNSLEPFALDPLINITVGLLCYLGAIGFIVVQDVYYSIRFREHMITFTSRVILFMTGIIFVLGTALFYLIEPSVQRLPAAQRVMVSAFQVMTASTTAGFNTVPIGPLGLAALWLIVIVMLIGASPSGTGGGIKTTGVSALFACVVSVVRGRQAVSLLGNEIPLPRLISAAATAAFYLLVLALGVLALAISEADGPTAHLEKFLPIIFEAASALGTVGLSMGATTDLSTAGKLIVIALMFLGRVGPLTIGIALWRRQTQPANRAAVDDLAV